jgi:hypothetical protein
MGDIPKPDSSVLLKNIFSGDPPTKPATPSTSSTSSISGENNNNIPVFSSPIFPPSISLTNSSSRTTRDENNSPDALTKKRKFSEPNQDDEDDTFGDEHIISATVVRRPFT